MLNFPTEFRIKIVKKIRPVGADVFHADGQTDRQTDRQTDGRQTRLS